MITKNYIKMCEEAKKIQRAWKKKKSHLEDKIYIKEHEKFLLIIKEIEYEYDGGTEYFIFQRAESPPEPIPFTKWNREAFYRYDDGELNIIYLPTQEQLWEMLPEIKDKAHVIFRFNKFLSGKYIDETQQVAFVVLMNINDLESDISISELLFAFVMYEKYNKIWTGSKWVKVE